MSFKAKKTSTKKKKTTVVDFLLTPKKVGLKVQKKSSSPKHEVGVTGDPLAGKYLLEYKIKF